MPRKKKEVNPKVQMIELLFGKDVSVEFAEKMLTKGWFENLEKHYQPEETPVETPKPTKNVKYKQAYLKLAKQVENMNAVVLKIKNEIEETPEATEEKK
jgi:hypothetical protein